MPLDLALFELLYKMTQAEPDLRVGQAIMNALHELDEDLAGRVPEEVDPFYDNLLIPKFWDWFYTEVEKEEAR